MNAPQGHHLLRLPAPRGLDFAPSRLSWHFFQAQNMRTGRWWCGVLDQGTRAVMTSCLGRALRCDEQTGPLPTLPLNMMNMVFPFHLPWYFQLSSMSFPSWIEHVHVAAMEAQRAIIERASRAGAADRQRGAGRRLHLAGKSFSFAVCHQQDSHPAMHDATSSMQTGPFLPFSFAPSASSLLPSPFQYTSSPGTSPEPSDEAFILK